MSSYLPEWDTRAWVLVLTRDEILVYWEIGWGDVIAEFGTEAQLRDVLPYLLQHPVQKVRMEGICLAGRLGPPT